MDQGGSVVNACEALGVKVINYNCHRVNSAVAKRHEVIYILNFVFVLSLFILNSTVLVCVAAVMHEIFVHCYTPFLFFSR